MKTRKMSLSIQRCQRCHVANRSEWRSVKVCQGATVITGSGFASIHRFETRVLQMNWAWQVSRQNSVQLYVLAGSIWESSSSHWRVPNLLQILQDDEPQPVVNPEDTPRDDASESGGSTPWGRPSEKSRNDGAEISYLDVSGIWHGGSGASLKHEMLLSLSICYPYISLLSIYMYLSV